MLFSSGTIIGLGVDDGNIVDILLLLDGPSILWTIPCEIAFYVIFGVFLVCGARGRLVFLVLSIASVLSISYTGNMHLLIQDPPIWLARWYVVRTFIFGAICYFVVIAGIIPRNIPYGISLVVGLVLLAFLFSNFPQIRIALTGEAPRMWGWREFETQLVCATVLVGAISLPALKEMFELSPMVFLGKISFSLYLTHAFVLQALQKNGLLSGDLGTFLGAIGACVAVASLSFFAIERPV